MALSPLSFDDYLKKFGSTVINFYNDSYDLLYGEDFHKLGNFEFCLFRFSVSYQMGKDVDQEKVGRKPVITDDDEAEFIGNLINNEIGKNLR